MKKSKAISQKKQAATLLLQGKGILEVAKICGIHRSTLFRWTKDPAFLAGAMPEHNDRKTVKRKPWYETDPIQAQIHKRICELHPQYDPADARLYLLIQAENDPEIKRLWSANIKEASDPKKGKNSEPLRTSSQK